MNRIEIVGQFTKDFYEYYTYKGVKYYASYICCNRFSGTVDVIPIVVSEQMYKYTLTDNKVRVIGEVRSHYSEHLNVYIFARSIEDTDIEDMNYVEISGRILYKSEPRKTPLDKVIRDVSFEAERVSGKKDVLPIIFWNKLARRSIKLNDWIHLKGRIQSRTYKKNNDICTAYEISIMEII